MNGIAGGLREVSGGMRKFQTGLVRNYALGDRVRHGRARRLRLHPGGVDVTSTSRSSPRSSSSPAIGAIVVLCLPATRPEYVKAAGYATTVATLGLAGYLLAKFKTGDAGYQFVSDHAWMERLGVRWTVGVDGISLFMVVLTALADADRLARVDGDRAGPRRSRSGCCCSKPD